MEQINKVLTAFKLCQVHGCIECPYFNAYKECKFELLAQDAENIINKLLKGEKR